MKLAIEESVLRQALEALGEAMSYMEAPTQIQPYVQTSCAITVLKSALRTALDAAEKVEPVAWMLNTGHGRKLEFAKPKCEIDYWQPLFTHPAPTVPEE